MQKSFAVPVSPQGVSLTAQRAAIVVGVELPVYDITKKHLIISGLMGDTVSTHFLYVCGFLKINILDMHELGRVKILCKFMDF